MANGSDDDLTPEQRRDAERKRRAEQSASSFGKALSGTPKPGKPKKEGSGKPRRGAPGTRPKKEAAESKKPTNKKGPDPLTITTSKYTWHDFIDDFVDQNTDEAGIDSWRLNDDLQQEIRRDPQLAESVLSNYDLTGMPDSVKQHLFGTNIYEQTDPETGESRPTAVTPELQIQETERRIRRDTAADSADDFDPTDPNYNPEEFTSVTEAAVFDQLGKQSRGGRGRTRGPAITGLEDDADGGTSALEPFRNSGVLNTRQLGLVGGAQPYGEATPTIQVTGTGRGDVAVPYSRVRPPRRDVISEADLDTSIATLGSLAPSADASDEYDILYLDPSHPAAEGRYGKRSIPRTNKRGKTVLDKQGNPVIAEEYHWMGADDARAVSAAKGSALVNQDTAIKEAYDAANNGTKAPERIAVRVPKDIARTPEETVNFLSPQPHGPGVRLYAPQGLAPVSIHRKEARADNEVRSAVGEFIVRMGLEKQYHADRGVMLDESFNYPVYGDERPKVDDSGNNVLDSAGKPIMEKPIVGYRNLFDDKRPEVGETHSTGISRKTYDFLQDVQMSGILSRTKLRSSVIRPAAPAGPTRERTLPSGARTRSVNNMRYVTDAEGNTNLVHDTVDESGNRVTNIIDRSELSQKILPQSKPSGDIRDVDMRLANPLDTSLPPFVTEKREAPFVEMKENPLAPKSPRPVENLVTGVASTEVTTLHPDYQPVSRRTGLPFSSTDLEGNFDIEGQKAAEFARDYQAYYLKSLLKPTESGKEPNEGLAAAQTGIPRRNVADTRWMRPTTEAHPLSFQMADITHPHGPAILALAEQHGITPDDALRVVRKIHSVQTLATEGMKSPISAYDERLWNAKYPLNARRSTSDFEPMTVELPDARGTIDPATGQPVMKRVQTIGIRPEHWTNEQKTGHLDIINKQREAKKLPPIVPGSDEEGKLWSMYHGGTRRQMTPMELGAAKGYKVDVIDTRSGSKTVPLSSQLTPHMPKVETPTDTRVFPHVTEVLGRTPIQRELGTQGAERSIVEESMASMAEAGGPMSQATYGVSTAGTSDDGSISWRSRDRDTLQRKAWAGTGRGSIYYSPTDVPKPQKPAPFVPRPSTVTEAEVAGTKGPEEQHFQDVRSRLAAITSGGINRPVSATSDNAADAMTAQERIGRINTMSKMGFTSLDQFGNITPAPLITTPARKNELWDIQNPRLGPPVPPPEAPKSKRARKPRKAQ